jgi:glyoxylate reductase
VTPHIASASIETRDEMARMAAENLLAGLEGAELPNSAVEDWRR